MRNFHNALKPVNCFFNRFYCRLSGINLILKILEYICSFLLSLLNNSTQKLIYKVNYCCDKRLVNLCLNCLNYLIGNLCGNCVFLFVCIIGDFRLLKVFSHNTCKRFTEAFWNFNTGIIIARLNSVYRPFFRNELPIYHIVGFQITFNLVTDVNFHSFKFVALVINNSHLHIACTCRAIRVPVGVYIKPSVKRRQNCNSDRKNNRHRISKNFL